MLFDFGPHYFYSRAHGNLSLQYGYNLKTLAFSAVIELPR